MDTLRYGKSSRKGSSGAGTVRQIVAAAVEEYLARHDHEGDDDEVERLAMEGARRWRPLLDRLAQ
ncbi:hypothetical protein [Microbispora triticiradicis]|uniref:hypothetical protein n=1 Tax=Microbispora triticiradicis TaxID=2200763 RepID=UPI001058809A|nr:hypothetical protein [Microbispora triticiradicis]